MRVKCVQENRLITSMNINMDLLINLALCIKTRAQSFNNFNTPKPGSTDVLSLTAFQQMTAFVQAKLYN